MLCCGRLKPKGLILPDGTEAGQFLEGNNTPSSWIIPVTAGAGDIGEVLTATAANVAEFAAAPVLTPTNAWHYAFGSQQVNAGTQYLLPFFSSFAATVGVASAPAAIAQFTGVIKTMYVTHGTPISADNIVYTVMINGVASLLAVTLNSGASGPGSNLIDTPAVTAGDILTLRCTGAAAGRACKPRVQFLLS